MSRKKEKKFPASTFITESGPHLAFAEKQLWTFGKMEMGKGRRASIITA